jgi:hypothetical protein
MGVVPVLVVTGAVVMRVGERFDVLFMPVA